MDERMDECATSKQKSLLICATWLNKLLVHRKTKQQKQPPKKKKKKKIKNKSTQKTQQKTTQPKSVHTQKRNDL